MSRGRSTAAALLVLGAAVTLTIVLAKKRYQKPPGINRLPGGYADVTAVRRRSLIGLDENLVITVGEDRTLLTQGRWNLELDIERLFSACVTPDPMDTQNRIVWLLGADGDGAPRLHAQLIVADQRAGEADRSFVTDLAGRDEVFTAIAPAPRWLAGDAPGLMLLDGRRGELLFAPVAREDFRRPLFEEARSVGSHPPDAPAIRSPLTMGFRDATRMRAWPREEDLERWTWIVRPLAEGRRQSARPVWHLVWEGDPNEQAFRWSHATDASYAREGLSGPHLALAPAEGSDEVWIHAAGVTRGHFEVMLSRASEEDAQRIHRPRESWPRRQPGDRHVVARLDRPLAAGDRVRIDHVWPDRVRILGPWTQVVASHPRPQVRWASGGPIRLRGPALSHLTTVSLDIDGERVEIPWLPVGRETIEIRDERALVEFAETILILENPGAPGEPTPLLAEVDAGVQR